MSETQFPFQTCKQFDRLPQLSYSTRKPNLCATRSHSLTLNVPFARTEYLYNSFFCQAPRLWNDLPFEVVSSAVMTLSLILLLLFRLGLCFILAYSAIHVSYVHST